MKLLFDENVSRRLARTLAGEFPGSAHVRSIGLRGAEDRQIWDYAPNEGFAIVSKDTDFREPDGDSHLNLLDQIGWTR